MTALNCALQIILRELYTLKDTPKKLLSKFAVWQYFYLVYLTDLRLNLINSSKLTGIRYISEFSALYFPFPEVQFIAGLT